MESATQMTLYKYIVSILGSYLLFAFVHANSTHINAVLTGKLMDPLNGTYSARSFTTESGIQYDVNFDFFYLDYSYHQVNIKRQWSCGETMAVLGSGVPERLASKINLRDPKNPKSVTGEIQILSGNKLAFTTTLPDEEDLNGESITLLFEKIR